MLLETKRVWELMPSVLARLSEILEDIQPKGITHWALQWIDLSSKHHLHYSSILELAEESRIHRGVIVENKEFIEFAMSIIDITDATFIALTDKESIHPEFILQNFDSTVWLLETNDKNIIQRLLSRGWQESEYEIDRFYYETVSEE